MSNIQIKHISWDLNKSFNISRGSKTTAETIEVKIETNNFYGYGECVPYKRYNETIDSVTSEIHKLKPDIEEGNINLTNLDSFLKNGAARNAIDCAMWDLKCKMKNTSIWKLME